MQELAVKRVLDESTRKQEVWMVVDGKVQIFSIHINNHQEVIITDSEDYNKIYCVKSLDFYNAEERSTL